MPEDQGPCLSRDQGLSAASWRPKSNLEDGDRPGQSLGPSLHPEISNATGAGGLCDQEGEERTLQDLLRLIFLPVTR